MREIYGFLRLARSFANPFGHPSVRKFWFCKLALTCKSVWPGLKIERKSAETTSEENGRGDIKFKWAKKGAKLYSPWSLSSLAQSSSQTFIRTYSC